MVKALNWSYGDENNKLIDSLMAPTRNTSTPIPISQPKTSTFAPIALD